MQILALVLLLIAAVTQAKEQQSADASIEEVPTCRLKSVFFPSKDHGWASDLCSKTIFESNDEGVTWQERKDIAIKSADPQDAMLENFMNDSTMIWPTENTGIVFFTNSLLRSVDTGKTWETIKLPVAGYSWNPAVRDGSIFACSDASIIRSTDLGAHWQLLPISLRKGSDCRSLALASSSIVWAEIRGRDAKEPWKTGDELFRSADQGTTWTQVRKREEAVGPVLAWDTNNIWMHAPSDIY